MKQLVIIALLFLSLTGCHELVDPLENTDINDIISIEVIDQDFATQNGFPGIEADSTSSLLIRAVLGTQTAAAQSIVFNTNHGLLTNVGEALSNNTTQSLTVQPAHREVIVQLNALDLMADTVTVSATVSNMANVIQTAFTPAYPEDFDVRPYKAQPSVMDTVTITIDAFRASSSVSENIRFRVSTTQPDSVSLDYNQFVELNDQNGSFKIINVSGKGGPVDITLHVPTVSDTLRKAIRIDYQ